MRFDGYGATIRTGTPRAVIECLSDSLHVSHGQGPALRRYGVTTGFHVGQRLAAWVGIDRVSGNVYVEAKGETSPAVVASLREHFPGHAAPRLDVCEDYSGEGAFSSLQALVRANKGPKVTSGYVALPDDEEQGRTWAAGKRGNGSPAYIRVYEPGKMKERVGVFPVDAARIELEAHPHYARDKLAAATMSPLQVWGLSSWTHRVGQALTQVEIPRFEAQMREYSYEKTTRYLATMFRRHLSEMIANGEDMQRTFQAIWKEEDELKRAQPKK